MAEQLPDVDPSENQPAEAAGEGLAVITIRVPRSLHKALKEEAHDRRTSMNQLCVRKLRLPPLQQEAATADCCSRIHSLTSFER